MLGGGFVTAASPIPIVTYGVGTFLMAAVVSILVMLGIAWAFGWL